MRKGYCGIFNLELLNFFQEPDFPATRVHLTVLPLILKNRLLVALLQKMSDLDPRSPISITRISNDITIPSVINEAG